MTFDARRNFAVTTVTVAPSSALGTLLTIEEGVFPSPPFNATVCPAPEALAAAKEQPNAGNSEILRVTAVTNKEVTVEREQEGTTARAIRVGDTIFLGVTARTLSELESAITSGATALTAETTRAESAETTIATNLAAEVTNRSTAVAAAIATAEAASDAAGTAATDVATETTRAQGAESTLTTNLATEVGRAEAAEALLAPKASPALTGNPTAPTQAAKDNSTKLATDAFVQTAVGEEATARATAVTAAIATAEAASDAAGTAAADVATEKTRAEGAEATKASTTALTTETTRAEAAEAEAVKLTGNQTIAGIKTFSGEVVVPSPANASDATNKEYVDATINGLNAHANVLRATTEALPASTYAAGVITGVALGALSINGAPVVAGKRYLIKNQALPAQNGIYVVTAAGGVAEAFVLTRATDINEGSEVPSAFTFVEAGSLEGTGWFTPGTAVTLGTTPIVWSQLPGVGDYVAGSGIAITGNSIAVSSSVVSGSLINAKNYATGNVVNMTNLVKAMEEERKGAYFPENMVMGEQVLLNKTHCAAPTTFQYVFYGLGGTRIQLKLPAMASGQFAFRINESAEGVKENEALYNHPDVIFENLEIVGSGSADGGSVASSYNRTFRIVNVQLKNLANGFVNKGFSDLTYIDGFTGDKTVTGWGWQGENGDAQQIHNVQFYASKGIFAKHGSGTATGLVSGEHKFIASKWVIVDDHLEGDGPIAEAGGKAQNPLIILEGGDYLIKANRLFTLTNPNRPCIEVNDAGQAERSTLLTLENTRFMQRLDDPANPAKVAEPIGNLQGVALRLAASLSTKTVIRSIDTHAECFQQTSESSRFDERAQIGLKITAGDAGLQEQLAARRVMLSSSDWAIRYNTGTEAWEIRPVGANTDSVTTRRFGQPLVSVTKFAAASEEAKAAPTTRGEGKHYYVVWAIDDRGRRTNLSTEQLTTLAAGEVPNLTIKTGQPCRVIIEHGTVAATFTEWVEVILPIGQAVLADMGNAIGGQEWSSTSLPSKPTTATAENNTSAGRVLMDSSGIAESYASAVFTTGEWQKANDLLYVAGTRYVCTASATGNNGGTWTAAPAGANELAEGESTIPREQATATTIAMTSKLLRLAFFTAKKTQTITKLRVCTSGTAAGATPTLIQLGVFSVNAETGELKLIAKTANDTTLLKESGTAYTKALEASWAKVAGERYAIGLLVVTAAAAPTIYADSALPSTELGQAPRLCAAQAAQETLPESVASGSLTNASSIPYFVATP